MALKKYIGARYTPKFMGAWDAQTTYAALSVVYANEQSYVSRKTVPAGTELTNEDYWVKSADWNAQVAEYNRNVENYNKNVEAYNKNVEAYQQAVNTFYADTLHSYDTKAEMVADQDLKLGDTLLTCGETAIGDGGGSFYQVVAETSAKAVALKNGLYALPFEFQPYDYSEFQTEVDNYKKETDAQVAEIKRVSLHTYDNEEAMKADTTLTADTTVLTTGKENIGDNLGSFWRTQETSSDPAAIELNNGIKAVPFALNTTVLGGSNLSFTGKSEAAGIWNVIAPANITIPLTLTQNQTLTTFVGVLYDSTQRNVVVNARANGIDHSFTFTDKADDNSTKIVVYAITVRYTDTIYWGSSVVSSWQTRYEFQTVTKIQEIGANAPTEWVLGTTASSIPPSSVLFQVTKATTLKNISINFGPNITSTGGGTAAFYKIDTNLTATLIKEFQVNTVAELKTFTLDYALEPNNYYCFYVYVGKGFGTTRRNMGAYTNAVNLGPAGIFNIVDEVTDSDDVQYRTLHFNAQFNYTDKA